MIGFPEPGHRCSADRGIRRQSPRCQAYSRSSRVGLGGGIGGVLRSGLLMDLGFAHVDVSGLRAVTWTTVDAWRNAYLDR
jgi:hypothetical protein